MSLYFGNDLGEVSPDGSENRFLLKDSASKSSISSEGTFAGLYCIVVNVFITIVEEVIAFDGVLLYIEHKIASQSYLSRTTLELGLKL